MQGLRAGLCARGALRVAFGCVLALLGAAGMACSPHAQDVALPDPVGRVAPEPRVARSPTPGASLIVLPSDVAEPVAEGRVFRVEIASTNATRERGLMGRETLGARAGMLFVYREPGRRSFWMKDCLIGLDLAFLDADGRVLQTATLPPGIGLTGDDVPSAACDGPVLYVLEVRARTLAGLGVGTGDLVDVREAIEGVVPE